jgi:formylglycine-generating enzyme required for sulfatase activity
MDWEDEAMKLKSIAIEKVVRGGSFGGHDLSLRTADRASTDPMNILNGLGFRCVYPVGR